MPDLYNIKNKNAIMTCSLLMVSKKVNKISVFMSLNVYRKIRMSYILRIIMPHTSHMAIG